MRFFFFFFFFLRGGGQGGLYPEKPLLFHELWSYREVAVRRGFAVL